jgi:hypothetical protein
MTGPDAVDRCKTPADGAVRNAAADAGKAGA